VDFCVKEYKGNKAHFCAWDEVSASQSLVNFFKVRRGLVGFSIKIQVLLAAVGDFCILLSKVSEFERSCAKDQLDW
jgi:hypothetical protein